MLSFFLGIFGHVKTLNDEPLTDAKVYIEELNKTVLLSKKGATFTVNLQPQKYTLHVRSSFTAWPKTLRRRRS